MTDDETSGPIDRALRALLDAEQHRDRVDERRRRSWLRQQAEESVALDDVLRALSDHGIGTVVRTSRGDLPEAVVAEVGRDYVALVTPGGDHRLVRLTAIASVRSARRAPDSPWSAARTRLAPELDLVERLADVAGRRPSVRVMTRDETIVGRLRASGRDLMVIDEGDGDVFVPVTAVIEVALDPDPAQSSVPAPLSAEPTTSG